MSLLAAPNVFLSAACAGQEHSPGIGQAHIPPQKCPFLYGGTAGHHLIHGSLDQLELVSQTASQSAIFFTAHLCNQHSYRDHAMRNVAVGYILCTACRRCCLEGKGATMLYLLVKCRWGAHIPFLASWACMETPQSDAWHVQRQTYGYLPKCRAVPLPLGWHLFPVSLRVSWPDRLVYVLQYHSILVNGHPRWCDQWCYHYAKLPLTTYCSVQS